MPTTYVALLPGFAAFYLARRYSVAYAFVRLYVPVLLLLPDYYLALTPGLPDLSFNQSALIVLFAQFLLQGAPGYRFSASDLMVAIYAFSVSYSEYQASGYSEAQNLMFFQLTSVLFPYILAKSLIEPKGLRVAFARQIVLCAVLITLLNLYENRFGMNLWQRWLGPLFPGFGEGWVTTFRFGIARASGPYGHALLAGIVMLVAYRLQRWLHWSQAWPAKPANWFGPSPAVTLTLGAAAGLLTTLAKGALLAAVIAASLPIIGRSKQRVMAVGAIGALFVFVGIPATFSFLQWASVGRMHATSDNQETAAYRYELVVQYIDIANQHLWFGWGLNQWPRVFGMPSVDNFYLLLYLMHGIFAISAFVMLILSLMYRLLAHGMTQRLAHPPGSSLDFTLAAILLGYVIAIATVYMGLQTVPLLFMILGWAEGYLLQPPSEPRGLATAAAEARPALFRFQRVV